MRGFGHVGYGSFLASQSFEAVFGKPPVFGQGRGPWYGGGAQFQSRNGWFLEGGIERFRQTGERVFVFDDTVFKLGIPNTITITPVTVTGGYRSGGRSAAPFIGGGIGRYFFSETTPFDEASEASARHATSYHALGGVEFRIARSLGTAVQVQYTRVPDALAGGVAATFNEPDLGGLRVGVKVLIGR